MASFSADLAAFAAKAKKSMDQVVRTVAHDLAYSVIVRSPVDTGRFRGNWQIGDGRINYDDASPVSKDGVSALARIDAVLGTAKAGGIIFITNPLPYGPRLEYEGWSKQAPAGMVRVTVQEYGAYVRKALAS